MYFSKTVLCFSKGIYFILDYLYTKVQNKIFIYIKSYKIILLKGHWTGDFGYLFFSLNMLGQPRKYGRHKKKLHQRPLRGSYGPLKSSRYCPVPRATVQFPRATVQFPHATVQFPRATVQFPRATVQFLALLSSFLALLSSFLALLSSSSCYCPVPRATVQFLALLSSFLELLSSPYFSFLVYRKQGTFLYFFFVRLFILLYQYTYSFKSIHFFPYFGPIHTMPDLISSRYCPVPRATVQFLALLSSSSCYCAVPRATVQFPRATVQYAPTGQ